MEIQTFKLEGLKLITLKKFSDNRGFFTERFNASEFKKHGIDANFIQDNYSHSNANVLRGMHFQWEEPQLKLVTCLSGKIFDVAVDIRKNSKTLGQHVSCVLDGENPQWFLIPPGFAHGFCVMDEKPAEVMYKVNTLWNAKGEGSLIYNDPELNIPWPVQNPILSGKDQQAPSFKEYLAHPKFF